MPSIEIGTSRLASTIPAKSARDSSGLPSTKPCITLESATMAVPMPITTGITRDQRTAPICSRNACARVFPSGGRISATKPRTTREADPIRSS